MECKTNISPPRWHLLLFNRGIPKNPDSPTSTLIGPVVPGGILVQVEVGAALLGGRGCCGVRGDMR
jgi:hypothetical protein